MTITFIFKPTYRPDLQAISVHATEEQIGMALMILRINGTLIVIYSLVQ